MIVYSYSVSMKMNTNNPLTVTATVAFIQEAHAGQKYNNMPYFFHPVEVAQMAEELATDAGLDLEMVNAARLVALLHDVVEDTTYTEADLRERYDDEIVDAVMLLTLKDGVDYRDNIQRIIDSQNTLAMLVKLSDNFVNRRGDKSKFKPEKAARLNERYDMSIAMLRTALAGWEIYV